MASLFLIRLYLTKNYKKKEGRKKKKKKKKVPFYVP
jgi:hypothetical protein